MRSLIKLLLGFLFTLGTALIGGEPQPPFSLAIVPTSSTSDAGYISTANTDPREFHVVLTNQTERPQPVWETSNSWGFWTISFEFTMADGKHITVTRNRKEAFTKNIPIRFLIPPGEHKVYPIHLDSTWDGRPTFPEAGETPVTMKVFYEVKSTPEAMQYGVWIGRIEANEKKLILRHW